MSDFLDVLRDYIQRNVALLFFLVILFVSGIAFGAFGVNALDDSQKSELVYYLDIFFASVGDSYGGPSGKEIFWHSFLNDLKVAGLIWFLGMTVIGVPVILSLVFLKGFMIGFTVGMLTFQQGLQGLVISFIAVFPQSLISVPALFLISFSALNFSLLVLKNRWNRSREPIAPVFFRHLMLALLSVVVFALASIVEGYISPVFLQFFLRLFS